MKSPPDRDQVEVTLRVISELIESGATVRMFLVAYQAGMASLWTFGRSLSPYRFATTEGPPASAAV
jgi:hypothetical protein